MLSQKIIIGLVGETGAGKDAVADYLHNNFNVELLRLSDPLKKTLAFFSDQPSKEEHAWLYSMLKDRYGEDVLHSALSRHIEHSTHNVLSVNGLRMPKDLAFIRSFPQNYLIYVTADQKLRWERTVNRGEKSDDQQTFEEFRTFEASAQTERAVPEIGAQADFRIVNDGTLEELLQKVDNIMAEVMA